MKAVVKYATAFLRPILAFVRFQGQNCFITFAPTRNEEALLRLNLTLF